VGKSKIPTTQLEKEFWMNQNLLSVGELAEKLNLPVSWVYSRTRETGPGTIPRVRLGKYVRFEWDKVKEWIERQNAE
jgi:excisionase family DNA binding protein